MLADDLLDIPEFLRRQPSPSVVVVDPAPEFGNWGPKNPQQYRREQRARLKALADEVQRAINGGATTLDALHRALPHLKPAEVSDGVKHLRSRKRLQDFLASKGDRR